MRLWTTFQIEKTLGIKRNRLKEWIDKRFVVPTSQVETGTGKKSLFNLWGLYCLKIFEQFLSDGFSREAASVYIEYLYNHDPENPVKTWDEQIDIMKKVPKVIMLCKNEKNVVYHCQFSFTGKVNFDRRDKSAHIFNFEKIKNEVDSLLID
jgi:hypothetical protein